MNAKSTLLYPLLIAIGSSTDNLTVGLTLGIKNNNSQNNICCKKKRNLSWIQFNLVISSCNAFGAWIAGKGGLYTINQMCIFFDYFLNDNRNYNQDGDKVIKQKNIPSLLAAIAFSYLAIEEMRSWLLSKHQSDDDSKHTESNDFTDSLCLKNTIQLAIPMTLNNLAGGVAGGTVGVSPEYSFIMAFFCSFIMMDIGFKVASKTTESYKNGWITTHIPIGKFDANIFSGVVFTLLASSQYLDYYNSG